MNNADNKRSRYVILSHTIEDNNWGFRRVLSESSGQDFRTEFMSTGNGGNTVRNLVCYLFFPLLVFLRRRHYDFIVANQQFYGILLAFYCRLFHVRKTFSLIIVSFIFKPKAGIIGSIYHHFMRYAVGDQYIDCFIVRSSHELKTYQNELGIEAERLTFIPLALGGRFEAPIVSEMQRRKYILSAGRSNHDYAFLISALAGQGYQVDIICDTCTLSSNDPNIHIHRDIFADFPMWVKNCFCVVIPLADTEVSSGQLVLLQAMMEGKPIIVTRAQAVLDYVRPNETALVIDNKPEQLINALHRLFSDKKLYESLAANEQADFKARFSADSEVAAIGQIVKRIADRQTSYRKGKTA